MTPNRLAFILNQFGENTFTTELNPSFGLGGMATQSDIDWAENEGYIRRHPGILGSRCSYFRTEKGIDEWRKLKRG